MKLYKNINNIELIFSILYFKILYNNYLFMLKYIDNSNI